MCYNLIFKAIPVLYKYNTYTVISTILIFPFPKCLNNHILFIANMHYVFFFREAGQGDSKEIGVKGLNLAMLFKRGFKVPPGFIISKEVCEKLLSKKEIKKLIQDLLKSSKDEIKEKAHNLQKSIKNLEFSEDVADEIIEAYLSLSVNLDKTTAASLLETKEVFVAVRSSYLEEKGQIQELSQKTILNVKGKDRLFKAILDCYSALFKPDLVLFKKENKQTDFSTAIIVQKMVNSEKSGVSFSANPETGSKREIIVNACFGLGEGLVSGKVFPDVYTVDKKTFTIKNVKIGEKQYEYMRDVETDETVKYKLGKKSLKQVLYDKDIAEIARITKKIANTFRKEQKIEWAIKKDIIYILQTKELPLIESDEAEETVEVEVYEDEDEDKPEIIDITELEDDLQALEEIEKYEKSMEESEEPSEKEESEEQLEQPVEEEETEYVVFSPVEESKEEPTEEKTEETKPEELEKIEIKEPEEEIIKEEKDDSIFSSYRDFDSFKNDEQPSMDKMSDLAKINAGNSIIYGHMVLKNKLKQKLSQYIREMPDDFEKILNELLEYENVPHEDELRKINKARNEFVSQLKFPEPEEVEMALRLMSAL